MRIIPALTAMLSAMLGGVVLLPRSRTRQHLFFGLLNLGAFCWSMAYFLGMTAFGADAPERVSASAAWGLLVLGQFGVAAATTYWLLFSLETVGLREGTRGGRLAALHIPGVALVAATLTNPAHGLFIARHSVEDPAALRYGPLAVPILVAVYGLVLVSVYEYMRARSHTSIPWLRRPYARLALAGLLPLIANVAWMFRSQIGFTMPYNPTIVVLALTNSIVGVSVFRAGLMDIVPTAEAHAFRAMHDAAVVLGTDGCILAMNFAAEAMLPEAVVGRSLAGVASTLFGLQQRARAKRETPETPLDFEATIDGRTFLVRLIPMFGPARRSPLGDLMLLADITERRAYENRILRLNQELQHSVVELEAATEAKNQFIANMSHELRTPLQSIIGYAGMVARGVSGPVNAEQADYVDVVLDSARHLHSLIDSLLDLSRIESGALDVSLQPVEACEIAESVVHSLRPLAERKGIDMRSVCGAIRYDLFTDPVKLRQILLNLVGNAVKFTVAGSIVLQVRGVGDNVRFAVMDTGPGIPEDERDEVFDAFHQVAASGDGKPQGAGLGLYLSRVLAEMLGGSLILERTSSRGCTFVLLLPVAAPKEGRADKRGSVSL